MKLLEQMVKLGGVFAVAAPKTQRVQVGLVAQVGYQVVGNVFDEVFEPLLRFLAVDMDTGCARQSGNRRPAYNMGVQRGHVSCLSVGYHAGLLFESFPGNRRTHTPCGSPGRQKALKSFQGLCIVLSDVYSR